MKFTKDQYINSQIEWQIFFHEFQFCQKLGEGG